MADDALEQLPEDEERQNAQKLVEKLREKYKDLPPQKQNQRIYGALMRKGFSYSTFGEFLNQDEERY